LVSTGGHTAASGAGVQIAPGASLTITNSTVVGNEATGYFANGAGISNLGTLALTNSTVANNEGGGVANAFSYSIATLANVTIYGNHGYSGGVFDNGTATLINTTVTGNVSTAVYGGQVGGGVTTSYWGPTTFINTIVAGNYAKNGNSDL